MPKRGYHHGNLRQALIEAALQLIEDKGPTGFTLSEAAKQAGVTPAAVYRHYEGREDLIAECARQGYGIFADLMEHAYQSGQPSALAAFEATGRAYLAFARRFPGHYIAMFESGISTNRTPELADVATRANAVLEKAARGSVSAHPRGQTPTRLNVFGPYLGPEPWGCRTVCAQLSRHDIALPTRGSARDGDRNLLARPRPDPARQLNPRQFLRRARWILAAIRPARLRAAHPFRRHIWIVPFQPPSCGCRPIQGAAFEPASPHSSWTDVALGNGGTLRAQ